MKKSAEKAMFAILGAPIVTGRKLMGIGSTVSSRAVAEFESWAKEGRKVSKQLRKNPVVSEIGSRVDLGNVQERVVKLRDQMDDLVAGWREGFRPESTPTAKSATEVTKASKPAAKKAVRKPAAKKAVRKPAAKKAAAARKPATPKSAAQRIQVEAGS